MNMALNNLFVRYKERPYHIGYAYLSNAKVPLILRHFGDGVNGMGNDGYHILVAAKTGGGKSTIAKMLSIGYAKYKNMAQLIVDPVGEFSKNAIGEYGTEKFQLNLKQYYEYLGRKVNVYNIHDLVFYTWDLFEIVLAKSNFFKEITIKKKENREEACRIIETEIRSNRNKITLTNLWKLETFRIVMRLLDDENIQRHIFGSDRPLADDILFLILQLSC